MSTAELRAALRKRYPQPTWCLLEEVPDRTGHRAGPHDRKRTADAIAIATWESRGLEVHGFELKDTRSDWLRELADPTKSQAHARYCDRWWLVISDAALVKDGELPAGWGLLVLGPRGLRVAVDAERRTEVAPLDRGFLAALMRRVTPTIGPALTERARRRAERPAAPKYECTDPTNPSCACAACQQADEDDARRAG